MKIKVWALDGQPQWTEVDVELVGDGVSTPVIAFDTDDVPYIKED